MSVTERELTAALLAHEALAEQGPKGDRGEKGDPGEPGRDGKDGRVGRDGTDGLTGPRGLPGQTGADGVGLRGLPGLAGTDGRDGVDGKPGTNGRDGIDGTPGERGPRGVAGSPGEKGDKGDPGKAGRDGSSAGAYTGIQIMDDGRPISSFALSLDFGTGIDVVMDRNVARASVSPSAGADANYVHDQAIAASTWTVAHGLGKRAAVTVVTSAGDEVEGDVRYVDDDTVEVSFSAPFAGACYVN